MFHAQSPRSMHVNQEFPVSIEARFLGGYGPHLLKTAESHPYEFRKVELLNLAH